MVFLWFSYGFTTNSPGIFNGSIHRPRSLNTGARNGVQDSGAATRVWAPRPVVQWDFFGNVPAMFEKP